MSLYGALQGIYGLRLGSARIDKARDAAHIGEG